MIRTPFLRMRTHHRSLTGLSLWVGARYATTAHSSTGHESHPNVQSSTSSASDETIAHELRKILTAPLPLGTAFRALSTQSKSYLNERRITLEQFLLRNHAEFAVFQEPSDRVIMASRARHVPGHAMRGHEATGNELFNGKQEQSPELRGVMTVLRYVPEEWSSYVELGIPESIRVNLMNRKPKAWFSKYPQYFEVSVQALNEPSFQVRRAQRTQK